MKVGVASDHAGFELKKWLIAELAKDSYDIEDLGAFDTTPSDYPDFAKKLGQAVADGTVERGILVCGSGIGACVAANKIRGIRAGLAHDTYSGHQGVEHDDMNVLCLGARIIGPAPAIEIARAFLNATFTHEERHVRRLNKVLEIENNQR